MEDIARWVSAQQEEVGSGYTSLASDADGTASVIQDWIDKWQHTKQDRYA